MQAQANVHPASDEPEQNTSLSAHSSMRLSTHRAVQLHDLNDRASTERVSYYCRAIKATSINNSGAARYFTECAQQWERIRIASQNLLVWAKS